MIAAGRPSAALKQVQLDRIEAKLDAFAGMIVGVTVAFDDDDRAAGGAPFPPAFTDALRLFCEPFGLPCPPSLGERDPDPVEEAAE